MEQLKNQEALPSVLSLAIPIAVENVLRNLINTLNVFFLSEYADAAASGVGVANQVLTIVLMFASAIAVGAAVIINHDLGAKDYEKASVSVMNSISVAAIFGAVVSLFLFFGSGALMKAIGLEGEVFDAASRYLRIAGLSSVFIAASSVLSTVFRSYKNARLSMIVITCANALNLLFTYSAIRFEDVLPVSALEGIAIGKVVCEGLAVVVLYTLMAVKKYGYSFKNTFAFDGERVKKMLSVGASSSAESLSYNIGTLLTTGFIASSSLGSLALSAKVYVGTINPYEQIFGNALGQSGQIISGRLIGAQKYDEAQERIKKLWKYLAITNIFFGVLQFALHKQLMGLFTDDPKVIAMSTPLFLFEIFINLSRTLNHCFNSANRSAGYVFWTAIVAVISLWFIYVGCGYIFCNVIGLGITGVWLAMLIDETTRGSFSAFVWLTKRWQKKFKV